MTKLVKAFSSDVKVVAGERAVTARISTSAVDRDGDVLIPQGCNAKNYSLNPVVFWNHNASSLPIGKCEAFQKGDEYIDAKVVFATRPESLPEGEEWMPDTLFELYKQGVLSAFSVGLIPTETRPPTKRDLEKYGDCKRVVSKWEIYEFSAVGLPANPEAVAIAVSKGWVKREDAEAWVSAHKPKAVEPEPEPVVEKKIAAVVPPKPKQKVYVTVLHRPADTREQVAKSVRQAVAKAMGRIYQD